MVLVLVAQENPFRALQRASLQPDSLPRSQERPRLNWTPGQSKSPDRGDLGVVYWLWPVARPHNSDHSWRHENWQTLGRVKEAKNVSGEQRHIDFDDAVDPLALYAIKR
jgi:hypothetical protein